ncbi:MAG: hypothetical protein GXP55_12420 [Deltaproteobacteria bacterium]|nr:hypothetical protein [Deltaproteobacteria bacterium]
MRGILWLMLLCCGGCYLSHGIGEDSRDAGLMSDSSIDAPSPPRDTGVRDARGDSNILDSRVRDSGRRDTGRPDTGVLDSGTPRDAGDCVLPVEAYPESDVCRPETGACITRCGTNQACIVICLRRDPTCQACAVRNALACFNSTPCAPLYPAVSCCVVNMCSLERVDEILNVCTALACGDVMQPYVDCAIADSRARCRRAIADCGLPPTLLGF